MPLADLPTWKVSADKMDYKLFLEQHNFLPLHNNEWKKITVDHTSKDSKLVRPLIKRDLDGYIKGIYVYTNLQGKVYYVGQGKLKARVTKKYRQATSQSNLIPTSRGLFFRSKKEVMNVYVRNVPDDLEQIALEAMLSIVLKPEYLDFLKDYNAHKKAGRLEELFDKFK